MATTQPTEWDTWYLSHNRPNGIPGTYLVFPKASGYLIDRTHGYAATQIMFAALGAVGLAFAFLLLRADRCHGGVLEAGHRAG